MHVPKRRSYSVKVRRHENHSCQGQPEVIEEIKRILFQHLAASEAKKP
jgi:hypothetical protein